MTAQGARTIIKEENLSRAVNWFDDKNLGENQVGIRKIDTGWEVYITDERATIMEGTEFQFDNCEEAYDALIQKARYVKRLWFDKCF